MGSRAEDVTVADVIRAVDGPLVDIYGLRPESVACDVASVLQPVWTAARSSLRSAFEHVTIADLAVGRLLRAVTQRAKDEDAWLPH